jgi:DNA-binding transcriptional LysR family regulator
MASTGKPEAPRIAAEVAELTAFVTVARARTVGRAARWLGRTQPSISARIASLERSWNTRLFRRVARGMELTPEGARLLPLAESSLKALEELDRIAGLPVAAPTELRIGSGDALGRELLPRSLSQLLRAHADLDVYLREGPGATLLDALRDGEIDLAFVVWNPDATLDGLDVQPWIESEVELLVPRGAPPRRITSIESIASQRLVTLHSGSEFRRHHERAFTAAGSTFRPAVEVGNLSLVRRFVAAGLGVAPVPAIAFGEARSGGTERRRVGGVRAVQYARAIRAGAPLSAPTRDLLRRLKA